MSELNFEEFTFTKVAEVKEEKKIAFSITKRGQISIDTEIINNFKESSIFQELNGEENKREYLLCSVSDAIVEKKKSEKSGRDLITSKKIAIQLNLDGDTKITISKNKKSIGVGVINDRDCLKKLDIRWGGKGKNGKRNTNKSWTYDSMQFDQTGLIIELAQNCINTRTKEREKKKTS